MSVCKRRIPAPISAAMCQAASGVCAPLGQCYLAMGAPAQGLREGTPSQTEPESGRDSSHSWCHPSAGQSSPVPMEYLASPGRAVLSGTPTETASVLVSWNQKDSKRCKITKDSYNISPDNVLLFSTYRCGRVSAQETVPTWMPKYDW